MFFHSFHQSAGTVAIHDVLSSFSRWWVSNMFYFNPWGDDSIWLKCVKWVGSTTNQFCLKCYASSNLPAFHQLPGIFLPSRLARLGGFFSGGEGGQWLGRGFCAKKPPFTRHGCGWCEVGQGRGSSPVGWVIFRAMEILPSYCIFRDYILF